MEPGDIGLWVGTRFISRGIQTAMKVYQKRVLHLDIPKLNHGFNVVDGWEELIIGESQSKGYFNVPFEKTEYPGKEDCVIILTPKVPYTKEEKKKFSQVSYQLSGNVTRYDFKGIWWQIIKSVTGKWYGPKGAAADNRMYCTEACGHCANEIRPGTFEDYSANPDDIFVNENYVVKYCPDKIVLPSWKEKATNFTNKFYTN